MDEIIPCLTDLIRDWKRDKPELDEIIIHKREDGIHVIIRNSKSNSAYIFGYIESDKAILGTISPHSKPRIIYAANPDFFDLLYKEFMSII
jgi:hypothetical protein